MMKKLLVVLAILALAVSAMAVDNSKTSPYTNLNNEVRDMYEGFENDWPPTGWTDFSVSGHSGIEHWFQGTNPFAGEYAAECQWDPSMVPQDNELYFTYTFGAGDIHLNFMISGSAYWSTNYDCTVEIDDTQVYSWAATYGPDNWVWENHDIDLNAYAGQTVVVTYRYTGYDGAAIYLDDVAIIGETTAISSIDFTAVKNLY